MPKKIGFWTAAVALSFALVPILNAQVGALSKRAQAHVELGLSGGYGLGYSLSGPQSYSKSWSLNLLRSANESGQIEQGGINNAASLGATFNYLFGGGLGLQLKFDSNLKADFTSPQSSYSLNWTWTTGTSGSKEESWTDTGDVTVSTLSLNVIYAATGLDKWAPYLSGGVSYFMGKIQGQSTGGFATTWTSGTTQYIDYVDIPLKLDTSFNGAGFNIGAGADVFFGESLAANIDARYFLSGKVKASWTPQTGTLAGNGHPEISWNFDQSTASMFQALISEVELNPSFLKISLGIKFLF